MVDVFTASVLLASAFVMMYFGFKGKPAAGLFSSFLFLIFGLLLLGSGFQYETGKTITTANTYVNYSIYELRYECLNATLDIDGSWDCYYDTDPDPTYFEPSKTYRYTLSPSLDEVNATETITYNSTRGVFLEGISLIFIFLGLIIGYFSGISFLSPKAHVSEGTNDEIVEKD